jgi:hypothetical protein
MRTVPKSKGIYFLSNISYYLFNPVVSYDISIPSFKASSPHSAI